MSTIKTNTLQNLAGSKSVPVDTVIDGSAKAWVNFNGTGTVAIRAAFNVTSITDNAVGDYTVNFATAMVDANYFAVAQNEYQLAALNSQAISVPQVAQTASQYRFLVLASYGSASTFDVARIGVAVFR